MYPGTIGNGTWYSSSFALNGLIALTANMKLIVNIGDPGPVFNIVEGGLDQFRVDETTGITYSDSLASRVSVYPNPTSSDFRVYYSYPTNSKLEMTVYDVTGKNIYQQRLTENYGTVLLGKNWNSGLYLIKIASDNGLIHTERVIKN
jgi:hypothetical protein